MKSQNKKSMFILIIVLVIFFVLYKGHKKIFGYSPVGYLYNYYWYKTHKKLYVSYLINNQNFPILFWRVVKNENNKSIIFESFIVNNQLITASLSNKVKYQEIRQSCDGKVYNYHTNINKKIQEAFVCKNNDNIYLKSFLCVSFSKKLCLFIYNYDVQYKWLYDKLLNGIGG